MKIIDFIKKQAKLRIFKVKNLEKTEKQKQKYSLSVGVRIKKLREEGSIKIFLVDGNKIRNFIDIDFTMGGHGCRYAYIPIDEVWIDSSNEDEKEEVIIHELAELGLMKQGINYNKAHDLANIEELNLREKNNSG